MYKLGSVQRKILLALAGGVTLGLAASPRQYFRSLRQLQKEWRKISQQNFDRTLRRLSQEKLIEEQKLPDGSFRLVLTKEGRCQAKRLNILGSSIRLKKPKKWDGWWRIVIFDIPEKERAFRDILREHLRNLEFRKLQQSVFVSPHPCEKAILELVALYSAGEHVRVITAKRIDNEDRLKKSFFRQA